MNHVIDPQLDTNFLIRLIASEPPFVAYARANRAAGLCYSPAASAEFLAGGGATPAQLQSLQHQFGLQPITGLPATALDNAARRLQNAFLGDALGRVLHAADAKILASAFLLGEPLATGDLQLFKRGRDLGLLTDFVGTNRPAATAVAYVARPIAIPP